MEVAAFNLNARHQSQWGARRRPGLALAVRAAVAGTPSFSDATIMCLFVEVLKKFSVR